MTQDEQPTLLVVDDKKNMLRLATKLLSDICRVRTASSGEQALELIASEPVHVVLSDLKMTGMDGLDVLRATRRLRPDAAFILMTAFATVGTAVEALKLGAFDYITKPADPEEIKDVVLRALAHLSARAPVGQQSAEALPGLLARSPAMLELARLVRRVANSNATALVLGETGTGKERVARAIHELSPRSSQRFIALNCAAIPPELLESELFGHAKGAFTGAASARKGLFEEAHQGTLFLDEIGDLQLSLQAKLTRTLEERSIRAIGEARERPVDVRLVAATHRNVEEMVQAGTFREDLWYRLNVAVLQLPPLRERREDIPLLVRKFLSDEAKRSSASQPMSLSAAALDALMAYSWPGNVRQLRSAIERARVVAEGTQVGIADLPPEVIASQESAPALIDYSWADAQEIGRAETGRRYLGALMERFSGRVAEAAAHAQVERESFYRLLRKHSVDPAAFREPRSK